MTEPPARSFDAAIDAGVLGRPALAAVRDGGSFVGVAPAGPVTAERVITARTVLMEPDRDAIAALLSLGAGGALEVRGAGRVPLRETTRAYDEVARGGRRGRWLLVP